jgi:secretion/DNA translocation related CpaE-like protein
VALAVAGGSAGGGDHWRAAVTIGADDVLTTDTDGEEIVRRLADTEQLGRTAMSVAVVGARGGVGASTFCTALALGGARRGLRPLLVDLDARGGGLDLVIGAEDADGLRWDDVEPVEGRVAGSALLHALPTVHGLHLLSCGRDGRLLDSSTVDTVIAAGRRAFDLVVLDLPRSMDEAALSALRRSTVVVVVAPGDVRGVAAGQVLMRLLGDHGSDVRVLARTGPGLALEPEEIADAVGAPLIAELREDHRAAAGYARGEAPSLRSRGPWAASVEAVLTHLEGGSSWMRAS